MSFIPKNVRQLPTLTRLIVGTLRQSTEKCRPKTVATDRKQTTTALTDNSYYRSRLPKSVSKFSNGSGQQTAGIDRRFRPRLQVITVGLDNQPTRPAQHSTTASHADRPSVPTVELGDRQYFKNSPKVCTRLLILNSKNAKCPWCGRGYPSHTLPHCAYSSRAVLCALMHPLQESK